MKAEKRRPAIRKPKKEKLGPPPGFVSLTSFKLKKLYNNGIYHKSVALVKEYESEIAELEKNLETSLRHRPWILFEQEIHGPEASDCDQVEKVTARLHTEEASLTILEEAPIFYPTKEVPMTEKIKLNPGPIDDTVLYEQKHHICNIIWGSTLLDEKKDIRNYNRFPVIDDHRVLYLLNVAGFYGLYNLGYRKVDNHLITALIERWRPETSTFHFPIGELTMTLQDIEVLGGVKVDGNALVRDESGFTTTAKHALVTDLLGIVTPDTFTDDGMIKFSWLCSTFNPQSVNMFSSVDYIMRVTRACMLLIIGSQYLQDDKGVGVPVHYLAYMRDFDICGQYSWGSAILGYTYRSLTKATLIDKERGKSKRGVTGALQLLQYWAWSRFRFMRPEYSADDTPPEGFPSYPFGRRLARCKVRYTTGIPFHSIRVFRDLFDMLGHRQVIWEPYPKLADMPDCSKAGQCIWRSSVPLICTDLVEYHNPERVMPQFGMIQKIPHPAKNSKNLRTLSRKGHADYNWVQRHQEHLETWNARAEHVQTSEFHNDIQIASDNYMRWYNRITRKRIGPPVTHPREKGVQQVAGVMRYMFEELEQNYENAVRKGKTSEIQKYWNTIQAVGRRPTVLDHAEIPHQQPSNVPPHSPSGPDSGPTYSTSDYYIPQSSYTHPEQNSQWSLWVQPQMATSSFAHNMTSDFFYEYQTPNPNVFLDEGPSTGF